MPRPQSLSQMIEFEAKRKPAVAELVARAPSMSDEEIETCVVPLPWYRKALREIRVMAFINGQEQIPARDPMGETRQWQGQATFIKVDRDTELEVLKGQYLWIP